MNNTSFMTTPLNWSNLKKNKCPRCNKSLVKAYIPNTRMFECRCGFVISEMRYGQIVSSKVTREIDESYYKVPDEK